MRHFISYAADGSLVGVHSHKFAQGGLGGWPAGFDLENGREAVNDDAREWANRILDKFAGRIEGFVLYDCNCPPTSPGGGCSCASHRRTDHMMNSDKTAIIAKLASAVVIDGGTWDGTEQIVRAPGTAIQFKVTCAEAVDGDKVSLSRPSQPVLWLGDPSVELTFTGGETPEFTVTAPAHGMTGGIQVYGGQISLYNIQVVGWLA